MADTLNIFNPDGTCVSEEEFLAQAKELYNEATSDTIDTLVFKATTSAENQIDPELVYKTFNFLERHFYINGEIDHNLALNIHQFITYWNTVDYGGENAEPIIIFINSPGGDLDATFSIIDSIETSSIPVYTVVTGRAWSGAFMILLAGTMRFGSYYSSYLFHEGSCGYSQDAHKIIQYTQFYEKMLAQMKDFILSNTKLTEEIYNEHQKDDWWLNSEQALKYGIIDKIYEGLEDITI